VIKNIDQRRGYLPVLNPNRGGRDRMEKGSRFSAGSQVFGKGRGYRMTHVWIASRVRFSSNQLGTLKRRGRKIKADRGGTSPEHARATSDEGGGSNRFADSQELARGTRVRGPSAARILRRSQAGDDGRDKKKPYNRGSPRSRGDSKSGLLGEEKAWKHSLGGGKRLA